MRTCLVYGLGQASSGDGLGLRTLYNYLIKCGHKVDIYSCWDKITGEYDWFYTHSLGFRSAVKYAEANPQLKINLVCIEAIPNYFHWLNLLGVRTTISVPSNIIHVENYYVDGYSWPTGCLINGAKNTPLGPGYGHSSVVEPVVKLLTSK